jgi:flagellar basal body-associated protein FliL
MHRIDNDYLEAIVTVATKAAPRTVKQGLRSKLPAVRDAAMSLIAKHIVSHLSNDSTMVIRTEIMGAVGCTGRPGVWGVDEPDPMA